MNKIDCQTCLGKPKQDGCGRCGGYKVIAMEASCEGCGRTYWHIPGAFTIYEGKEWYSFDGLKFVVVKTRTGLVSKCQYCPKKNKREAAKQASNG